MLDHADAYPGEVAIATELLGDLAARQGDRELAERYYRRGLADPRYPSGTTGSVEISLAELLLDKGGDGRDEAVTLLHSWLARSGLKFDSQMFRWHLAVIKVAEQTGDRETVRRAANIALELASRGPQLPQHEDVGLVRADAATMRRLRKLAR